MSIEGYDFNLDVIKCTYYLCPVWQQCPVVLMPGPADLAGGLASTIVPVLKQNETQMKKK